MSYEKASARSGNWGAQRAGSRRTKSIVADREDATLVAGLSLAVCFGLMFVYAAVVL